MRSFRARLPRPRRTLLRWQSTFPANKNKAVLHIPSASIFHFTSSNASKPELHLDWTIREGESWAIVGEAKGIKQTLLETLKGQTRIKPAPPGGIWPFLFEENLDPLQHVRSVSFAHRRRATTGDEFYDYSAKYGAIRAEDKVTLRQYLLENVDSEERVEDDVIRMADRLELGQYLDLPIVALSNGQTRRARIVKALLHKPKVLLLDEPLTGLDSSQRPRLVSFLQALHKASSPRIIMSLRVQDPVPEWISHVALVQAGGEVVTGPKARLLADLADYIGMQTPKIKSNAQRRRLHHVPDSKRAVLVDFQGVNVSYHERHVLKNITWTIREGERWLLRGPNGSGKTTLLSMVTGDHPQSYTQKHLYLFGVPRRCIATPELARRIGISSSELFNAFPRRSGSQGLTVRDAIATGFEGIFTYRKPTTEQAVRIDSLLEDLGPTAWSERCGPSATAEFGNTLFADLTSGDQALVLLLRALVTEPALLILDEAFSGMDEMMVRVVTKYLRERVGERQSIIWVSHWDSETPWHSQDGLLKFTLDQGYGRKSLECL